MKSRELNTPIKESTMRNLYLENGRKQAYYFPSKNDPTEGIIVLIYDNKKNTMMASGIKYFNKISK